MSDNEEDCRIAENGKGEEETGSKGIVSNLVDFLCDICPGLLSTEVHRSDLLDGSNAYALLECFSTNVELSTLFIEVVPPPQLNGGGGGSEEFSSSLSLVPTSTVQPSVADVVGGRVRLYLETGFWRGGTSVAFIKRFLGSSLSPEQPMGSQLQIINFPSIWEGNGVFEILQVYIQCAFTPVTVAAVQLAGAADKSAASGSSGELLTRRLKELELTLSQCQKQLEIPSVRLQPHLEVIEALKRADEGVSLDIEALGLSNLPDDLLNEIQAGVNDWVRDIRRLTQLTSLPFSGTALEEVTFWHGLGEALQATAEELESLGVVATVMLLKQAKRYLATVALDTNTGLKDALDVASDVNTFLKGFPIDALVSTNDLAGLSAAITPLFNHFGKLKNSKHYPLERAAQLMESVETAFTNQLTTILATKPMMALDYPAFEVIVTGGKSVIDSWETGYNKFREFFEARCRKQSRILSQRLNGTEILGRLTMSHTPLAARLSEVASIRAEYEKFKEVVDAIFEREDWEGGASALRDITATYEPLLTIDALNLSSMGCMAWVASKEAYEGRRDKVEGHISSLLSQELQRTSSAKEMFNVFAQFNQLFIRPRIRASIGQFQQELINHVRNDVEALQGKFTQRYETSEAKKFADLRDIPPMSGKMVWARQIKRQLGVLVDRLENVLGSSWAQHRDGRQLKSVCDELMRNLDTNRIFMHWLDGWKQDLSRRSAQAVLNLYLLTASADCNGDMQLTLNFDMAAVSLFKEIRHLEWLGFEVPEPALKVMNKMWELGNQSAALYPHAVALAATLRTREQVIHTLQKKNLESLLVPQLIEARGLIYNAFRCVVNWASPDTELQTWVTNLADSVFSIQQRADELEVLMSSSDKYLSAMEDCPLSELRDEVAAIQSIIDQMSLSRYSNIKSWVQTIDLQVEDVLLRRLEEAASHWLLDVALVPSEDNDQLKKDQQQQQQHLDQNQGYIKHEILIQDQVMVLVPPLEHGCEACVHLLHNCLKSVSDLPRLHIDSFAVFEGSQTLNTTYDAILTRLNRGTFNGAYSRIQALIDRVDRYINGWLRYQSLWDMNVQDVAKLAGKDVDVWVTLIQDVKSSRREIERASVSVCFGPLIIDVSRVQAKAALKFDAWQHDLLSCFGSLLSLQLGDLYEKLINFKFGLETATLEGSTSNVILSIVHIQEMQTWSLELNGQLKQIDLGVKLLRRQRFSFPTDFPQISVSMGAASDFKTILTRRVTAIDERMLVFQERITTETKNILLKVENLLRDWLNGRPMGGIGLSPSTALGTINHFSGLMLHVQQDLERLSISRQFLHLEALSEKSRASLSSSLHEIEQLREVWSCLSGSHEKMSELLDMPWVAVVPRKLKVDIESIAEELQSLPNRIRQYEAYADIREIISKRISVLPYLTELKSGALRDRHWHTILSRLNLATASGTVSPSHTELTLGNLWDATSLSNVTDVVVTAQGEMALEEFLREVCDFWMAQEFELVPHGGGRVHIIRKWGDLFTKIDEHLNSIASMRMSPYFTTVPEFLAGAALWEDHIGRLQTILDLWNNVQRKWVYLEGVFFANEDIRIHVPSEYSRFKAIDKDFVAMMRRVATKPSVLELLSGPQDGGFFKQLDRQETTLSKIQKMLGEYLECQRASFSRFYFVGDEDLLEIIGNCSEPGKISPHLSKMFAGMSRINLASSSSNSPAVNSIVEICSKDGEMVSLEEAVTVDGKGPIEWLGRLEHEMRLTIYKRLCIALFECEQIQKEKKKRVTDTLYEDFPAQVGLLAAQVVWCAAVEASLGLGILKDVENEVNAGLQACTEKLANSNMPVFQRRKYERLLVERVYQRDKTNSLLKEGVCTVSDFAWQRVLRFNVVDNSGDELKDGCVCVHMADAVFDYGFEYLGIGETLVQTPLTDRCYLMLTQALKFRMGGNPFGPAGTGKTESIKNLGAQLGRFVLVFNCDETFDYSAMGRLLAGICRVGAWGCFDEFNRLEERILSAISQQILAIQRGLQMQNKMVNLNSGGGSPPVALHPNLGIFITMNPDYEGRSNLPDNLKQLFRAVAMVAPDRSLIARVLLFSQGLKEANILSSRITLLFQLCEEQLSRQNHYDFGLRALKSVVVSTGRLRLLMPSMSEVDVLVRSTWEAVTPKLVTSDLPIFTSLVLSVFPGCEVGATSNPDLYDALVSVCKQRQLDCVENEWIEKVLQLSSILELHHGAMLVGPSGSGKSSAWQTLLAALEIVDGCKGTFYVIDAKALSKDLLYGRLDSATLQWTDGVFTKLVRDVIMDRWGDGASKRHWIVFDGDVDPEWAENLNSVLDDNKLLTLPSGERLELPSNIRILIETDCLIHTTPATISRCGMVWFSSDTVTTLMTLERALSGVKAPPNVLNHWSPEFLADGGVIKALEWAFTVHHIMNVTRDQLIGTVCSLLKQWVVTVADFNEYHVDSPMSGDHLAWSSQRWLLYSLFWGLGSSMSHENRHKLSKVILSHVVMQPGDEDVVGIDDEMTSLLDVRVIPGTGVWKLWTSSVPKSKLESHHILIDSDVVITTVDTIRHTEVLKAWILNRKPFILCGPPGSGKTMILAAMLKAMPDVVVATLSFSTTTSPSTLLKTFAQYCDVVRTSRGLVMQPSSSFGSDKWVIVFCDEINLPAEDEYGTQTTLTFLRQLVEHNGFWRAEDCSWVTLNRVQFVGTCNPPTDAGRVTLSNRFLRHTSLLFVDFPTLESLHQIYSTFSSALLQLHPNLRNQIQPLTNAMIDVYTANQRHFTPDTHKQYVYSPRELSRWVRAIYEYISPLDSVSVEELVRVWAHEALRLFCDRLVSADERAWCEDSIDAIALKHFPNIPCSALRRPILFSSWLSQHSESVDKDVLHDFLSARLRVFYEEELDVPLILFDDALEHVLRIDRVLRQRMGHLLLVGESGVGKSVFSKFVCWMNGLSIYQLKTTQSYTLDQFDEDLRGIMRKAGCENERLCFIFDESNILEATFMERMNALLASGEIPGLFEGDDYKTLITACRESAPCYGVSHDSEEELFKYFTAQVQRNLHVVFTMNPANDNFRNRCVTSPALFNRCVVNWFGTWGDRALTQVAAKYIAHIDTDDTTYELPLDALESLNGAMDVELQPVTAAIVTSMVRIHTAAKVAAVNHNQNNQTHYHLSPRDFLDFIASFVKLVAENRSSLEDQQLHINIGLRKLAETQESVATMQRKLEGKEANLKEKNELANSKLEKMVEGQNEAERRKADAESLRKTLELQKIEIATRQEEAQSELSEAEPALLAAQTSVRSIRKTQLDEIRAMARPPKAVQTVLEAVSIMLGYDQTHWSDIRKIISKQDYIATVLNFDAASLTQDRITAILDMLERESDLDQDSVQRASRACGPLYAWVMSSINFNRIAQRVAPLREQVADLEKKSEVLATEKSILEGQISELEKNIVEYKQEYAESIRDIETIKVEMNSVRQRVHRAEALLRNLIDEKRRWKSSSEGFSKQRFTLIGNCLLGAAFLTYGGMLDFRTRKFLVFEWNILLKNLNIEFQKDLGIIDYLSRTADRLQWVSQGLPQDDLAIENAIILERFNRYPLVVDPSGQATAFLMAKYRKHNIVKTSFLDRGAGFMKTLGSAIRFGTPLLIEDAEAIDPVLNPILNREIQRTGGRTFIRLGSEDIDYSPQFLVILSTRNSVAHFSPDLCSRVTLVNFTITPSSLQNQSLQIILSSERPDIEARRTRVIQLQGEQSVKLRTLEDRLLDTISAVQGEILEDDTVMGVLEDLKVEAGDVVQEVHRISEVMAEIEATSRFYEPISLACGSLYFAMAALSEVHSLYQFSLQLFLSILSDVLKEPSLSKEEDECAVVTPVTRLTHLNDRLYAAIARRVGWSLMKDDKLAFALRLAQIFLSGTATSCDQPSAQELDLLYGVFGLNNAVAAKQGDNDINLTSIQLQLQLTDKQRRELGALTALPSCTALVSDMKERPEKWQAFMSSDVSDAVQSLPDGWISSEDASNHIRNALLRFLVVKTLRSEAMLEASSVFLNSVFGPDFQWYCSLDIGAITACSSPHSPILLVCEAGYDAGHNVEALASSQGMKLTSIAMGSAEGFPLADRSLSVAAKEGSWVLLRNCHVCPQWLDILEKHLHGLSVHSNFHLFLTADVNAQLPNSLLLASEVVVVEVPSGLRSGTLRFFRENVDSMSITTLSMGGELVAHSKRTTTLPIEVNRIHALLAWLHAVIIERLRYVPVGWSKRYKFSETDALCALRTVNDWMINATSKVREGVGNSIAVPLPGNQQHISPDDIPWSALRALLKESIYGGKVDNDFDRQILYSFIDSLFTPSSFDLVFNVVPGVTLPDSSSPDAFVKWAENLPHSNPTSWLGMGPGAEISLLLSRSRHVGETLLALQDMNVSTSMMSDIVDVKGGDDGGGASVSSFSSPSPDTICLKKVQSLAEACLCRLPSELPVLDSKHNTTTTLNHQTAGALWRCIGQEIAQGATLATLVKDNLNMVVAFCIGKIKSTNEIRYLVGKLSKGMTPESWRKYEVYVGSSQRPVPVTVFIEDLKMRLLHLKNLVCTSLDGRSLLDGCKFWLGGLSNPKAFLTSMRQHISQDLQCPLESLSLKFSANEEAPVYYGESEAFAVTGVALQGAGWENGLLTLSSDHEQAFSTCWLSWAVMEEDTVEQQRPDKKHISIQLPMYLAGDRMQLLTTVQAEAPINVPIDIWYRRGVALIVWNPPV